MSPDDCPHTAMKVEPGWRICSLCGVRMRAYATRADAVAAMREMIRPTSPRSDRHQRPTCETCNSVGMIETSAGAIPCEECS